LDTAVASDKDRSKIKGSMEIDFTTTELLIRNDLATQPDNGGTTAFVISIIFAILSSVVVAGRLASRLSLGTSFGLDDVAIVVSLVRSSFT
jgi:hypothetical protein